MYSPIALVFCPNFARAKLEKTDLSGCNLSGCDFRDANLKGADFSDSILNRVYFKGADLTEANLSGANIRGSDMGETRLIQTNLAGADLTLATNLTSENLKTALIDRKTKLPENLEIQWISETEFECTESASEE